MISEQVISIIPRKDIFSFRYIVFQQGEHFYLSFNRFFISLKDSFLKASSFFLKLGKIYFDWIVGWKKRTKKS